MSLIEANSNQPRKTFNEEKLLELSNSIKNIGQINPIIVRESPKNKNKYIVVAGERRWRASKIAGLKNIDVIISDKSEKISSLASVIENVQREDLNSLEEAEAYNMADPHPTSSLPKKHQKHYPNHSVLHASPIWRYARDTLL